MATKYFYPPERSDMSNGILIAIMFLSATLINAGQKDNSSIIGEWSPPSPEINGSANFMMFAMESSVPHITKFIFNEEGQYQQDVKNNTNTIYRTIGTYKTNKKAHKMMLSKQSEYVIRDNKMVQSINSIGISSYWYKLNASNDELSLCTDLKMEKCQVFLSPAGKDKEEAKAQKKKKAIDDSLAYERKKEENAKRKRTDSIISETVHGMFVDVRDGKQYKTVRIGRQVWMAENLNYKVSGSFCYDNNEMNCAKFGRLYNWAAALEACPQGWHIPSDDEWTKLTDTTLDSNTAGTVLKANSNLWRTNTGTDIYGFSVLPTGYRYGNGTFGSLGDYANFWSSSESDASSAWSRSVLYAYPYVGRSSNNKIYGFSLRCLEN